MTAAIRIGLILAAVAALLGSPPLAVPAHAQDEIVARGNQLYQDGDFAAAAEAYESVLAAGFESADLHYNLGNAYFKRGDLGLAILAWERALSLAPGAPDVAANLELARSLTADVIEPLPRFWLVSALSWWRDFIPRGLLVGIVAAFWLAATGGATWRILARGPDARRLAGWVATVGAVGTLLFGLNLTVRELGVGRADRAVILSESVAVRSAPAEDDNLTLFQVHEGTVVRVDGLAGEWAEIVLADGKVGWVRAEVMEVI
jgi:tetratricopeptide (TPR) repeat protein